MAHHCLARSSVLSAGSECSDDKELAKQPPHLSLNIFRIINSNNTLPLTHTHYIYSVWRFVDHTKMLSISYLQIQYLNFTINNSKVPRLCCVCTALAGAVSVSKSPCILGGFWLELQTNLRENSSFTITE